ncbi:MAG: hypothetical protein DRO05_06255 [Thermoproteota archaeon]|nr:MAG: hypothetical protein DRO05_06255 [Candidatus Korarchaeota archaeon]
MYLFTQLGSSKMLLPKLLSLNSSLINETSSLDLGAITRRKPIVSIIKRVFGECFMRSFTGGAIKTRPLTSLGLSTQYLRA